MPRQDQQQRTARAPANTQQGGRQVASRVAAQGADNVPNYIPQMHDPDVQGFLQGMSQFSPALAQHADEGKLKEMEQARVDKLAGLEQQSDAYHYQRAYFQTEGMVRAQEDAASLGQQYNTAFDKDKGDLEGWLAETYQGRLKGIKDEHYLEGYNKGIAPALAQIRAKHLEYQKKSVESRVESNAMQMTDGVLRAYVTAAQPVDAGALANLQDHFGKNLGVSQQRFQELVFESAKRLGDEGHFDVYELLKADRPDGSPGLYYDPKWKEKIDSAELHSFSAHETRSRAARDQKQNEMLFPVFSEEDPKKAQQMFNDLRKSGLFTRADDLIKWEKLMREKVDGQPDVRQLEKEGDLLAKVYRGGMDYRTILDANARGDITSGQRKYLLSETRRVSTENRQLAATAGKAEEAIFKTTEFRSAEDFLQGMLKPRPKGAEDIMGQGSEFDRAQLATARLELTRAVKGRDASEIQGITEEVVNRYMKRRQAYTQAQQESVGQGKVPFKSLQEVRDAAAKGALSPAEVRTYINYFKENNG